MITHLLKWQYQPSGRQTGHNWRSTIRTHGRSLPSCSRKAPSCAVPCLRPSATAIRWPASTRATKHTCPWRPSGVVPLVGGTDPGCRVLAGAGGVISPTAGHHPGSRCAATSRSAPDVRAVVACPPLPMWPTISERSWAPRPSWRVASRCVLSGRTAMPVRGQATRLACPWTFPETCPWKSSRCSLHEHPIPSASASCSSDVRWA